MWTKPDGAKGQAPGFGLGRKLGDEWMQLLTDKISGVVGGVRRMTPGSCLGNLEEPDMGSEETFTGNLIFPGFLSPGSVLVPLNRFQSDHYTLSQFYEFSNGAKLHSLHCREEGGNQRRPSCAIGGSTRAAHRGEGILLLAGRWH